MSERSPYPSDLSDARWKLIEPVLAAWRFERRGRALDFGRPPSHDLREIMDAILYVDRTGVQWRYLPHDFPPWETVYRYFEKWQKGASWASFSASHSTPSRTVSCSGSAGRRTRGRMPF